MIFTPDQLEHHLQGLEKHWFKDQLATLLSNSRTEMNIRDKFNLQFAKILKGNDAFHVQREWTPKRDKEQWNVKRVDLAIIEHIDSKTRPAALFEFKARHTAFIGDSDRGPSGCCLSDWCNHGAKQ